MQLTDYEWIGIRKLLNKAWDKGKWRTVWHRWKRRNKSAEQSLRYRDVSKIIKTAKAVDWSKLNKPDNVEGNDG